MKEMEATSPLRGAKGPVAAVLRRVFPVLFLVLFLPALACHGREITDMKGKRIVLPDSIKRVYSSSPPVTILMVAIDPAMLVGLTLPINEGAKPFLPKTVHNLPVLGGFFGRSRTVNMEMILKSRPDVIITGGFRNTALNDKYEESLKTLGIPIFYVSFETLPEYAEALKVLGNVLAREERTKKLAAYGNEVLAKVNKGVRAIPASKRPTVYYAEGMDGLLTECTGSPHTELIDMVGAKNVNQCTPRDTVGMETVSLEQVTLYNPDVIIVEKKAFYDKIFSDPGWKKLKAVRTKRVYLIPNLPFNWFDRPPSFMRFLGIQWLMSCLYPQDYPVDLVKESQAFYRLFLGVDVKAGEMRRIIYP